MMSAVAGAVSAKVAAKTTTSATTTTAAITTVNRHKQWTTRNRLRLLAGKTTRQVPLRIKRRKNRVWPCYDSRDTAAATSRWSNGLVSCVWGVPPLWLLPRNPVRAQHCCLARVGDKIHHASQNASEKPPFIVHVSKRRVKTVHSLRLGALPSGKEEQHLMGQAIEQGVDRTICDAPESRRLPLVGRHRRLRLHLEREGDTAGVALHSGNTTAARLQT